MRTKEIVRNTLLETLSKTSHYMVAGCSFALIVLPDQTVKAFTLGIASFVFGIVCELLRTDHR